MSLKSRDEDGVIKGIEHYRHVTTVADCSVLGAVGGGGGGAYLKPYIRGGGGGAAQGTQRSGTRTGPDIFSSHESEQFRVES